MTPIQERVAQMLARIGPDDLWRNSCVQPMISLMRELLAENEKLNRWMNYRQVSESTDIFGNLTTMAIERPSPFTDRRTARNRADIPTNAGVPLREAELREIYEQECGGTISYDESRIDTIASNGNTNQPYN